MKRNYDAVDLAKFVLSIFIVALHADALYDVSPLLNTMVCGGIARLGVPFFFVVSAFFFFAKPVTWVGTKNYCKRLLTLYAAWFVVSIPKTIFDRFYCSDYPFGETLFRFVRSFFVTSTFSGSWFLVSCLWCALLYYWLEQRSEKVRRGITVGLSVVVYLWVVFSSAYGKLMTPLGMDGFYRVYSLLLASPYTSFLVGIPYFALGRYFAKRYYVNLGGVLRKERSCRGRCLLCAADGGGLSDQYQGTCKGDGLLSDAAAVHGVHGSVGFAPGREAASRQTASRGVDDCFLCAVYPSLCL